MCGITGWIAFDHDLVHHQETVDAMTWSMAPRGPDASGVWVSRHAALGHRRLAIIDLAGGTQPMTVDTPHGPVAMTYSGEVYNFVALRRHLRGRGHRFRTDSDTEVVLHSYLEWGEEMVDHLVGMYAFAIWDGRCDRLLMVRDRLGIKPLYYHPTEDGVLFASEPKGILAHPAVEACVDHDGLRDIMLGVKTPGTAIWHGMQELKPGSLATADRGGVRETTYWRLTARDHTDDLDTTVARTRELLTGSVREQLVADVPRCVLLSGGLDSSTIAGLAANELSADGRRVRTFSVDFPGHTDHFARDSHNVSPDAPYVRIVAEHLDADHSDLMLDATSLSEPAVRRAVVQARDLPVGRGDMDHSLIQLFTAIRDHSTVALSGEGADEMFGGYWWFHDPVLRRSPGFPWLTAALGQTRQERAFLPPDLSTALDLPAYATERYREAVAETPSLDGEDSTQRRSRELLYLHLTRSLAGMLDRKDRLSMAVGLEVRVPFCDHRIAEYAFNTPWSFHTVDAREKSILRAAGRTVVPDAVLGRLKSPYPMTRDHRYVSALQEQVREALSQPDHDVFSLFDKAAATKAAYTDHDHHPNPHGHRAALEKFLDLQTWLDLYRPRLTL
ncbi:asparagine synthase (glutamine-hydrolyzing) [Streptomyces griseochromogenes]|uniref:asparagine synthase (glutamine-hydrolyzing) n=1 Tax=Streptomyces griseochromogenes TaxID=68214 RepID=A0A1B1B0B2_9ACTN|nr:asparagine synthase (glutamine-hydrolyzing) [Streptomyces griseochromogenes]ANP52247.1 asparagine synthase (glutamine-hydrolyzing) [Streptomyces griseochromogenes]MBP2055649.1 asparagine synthase (glutamine-hydrolyzing) [Streptomyces griseochromogenes]